MEFSAIELLVIVIAVSLAVGLHAVLQRQFNSQAMSRHNDVAGYLFSAVGVLYAVLLGFTVVVVWEKYDQTVDNVTQEVAAVSDLYRTVGGFSDPERDQIRSDLRTYVDDVINIEWPQMHERVNPPADVELLENMAQRIDSYQPKTASEIDAQQMAMTQRSRLFDARRHRLIESAPAVPLVLWFALFVGALAMLAFAFLFGVENRNAQLVMTAILAGLIAVLFVVVDEFDHPFSGTVAISDDAWVTVRQHLPEIP